MCKTYPNDPTFATPLLPPGKDAFITLIEYHVTKPGGNRIYEDLGIFWQLKFFDFCSGAAGSS